MGATTKRRTVWGIAIVLALACVALYLRVGPSDDVPDPTAGSTPEEVVQTYVDAMRARDRSTMHTILLRDEYLMPTWTDSFLGHDRALEDVTITPHREWSRPGTQAQHHRHAVYVPVEMSWSRETGRYGHPLPTTWGYVLVRDSTDEPWAIIDMGV